MRQILVTVKPTQRPTAAPAVEITRLSVGLPNTGRCWRQYLCAQRILAARRLRPEQIGEKQSPDNEQNQGLPRTNRTINERRSPRVTYILPPVIAYGYADPLGNCRFP